MLKAIVTHKADPKLTDLTFPFMKAYAKNIKADFLVLEVSNYLDVLEKYDRVANMEPQLLIRPESPDIFEEVPEDSIGVFNEAAFNSEAKQEKFFNSGLIVYSKAHKEAFNAINLDLIHNKQYLGTALTKLDVKVHELDYKFNRIPLIDFKTGETRFKSWFLNYENLSDFKIIENDIKTIKEFPATHPWKRKVWVKLGGGIGDQVDCEPILRYMIKNIYPPETTDVRISSHWPELFSHLPVKVYKYGETAWADSPDGAPWTVESMPPPEHYQWLVVSAMLCHATDFSSMAILRRTLPLKDKQIKLDFSYNALKEVQEMLGEQDVSNCVLVHSGRHWNSKAQPLYSKIKTPNGWTTMGAIQIDDRVCTPDGKTAKVKSIHPQGIKKIYRIKFWDGRHADCTSDHLWRVYHENFGWTNSKGRTGSQWKLMTLQDLLDNPRSKKHPYYIQLADQIYGEEIDLPIPPYLLGALLGNGSFSENQTLQFSGQDQETIDNMSKYLDEEYSFKKYDLYGYTITAAYGNRCHKYKKLLRSLDLWGKGSFDKFIPEIYKEASHEQRLSMLQGLMDTDGYAGEAKTVAYYTISPQLAKDVQYLVRSLGGTCTITEKTRSNGKKKDGPTTLYTCNIRHDHPENFFRLTRKKERAYREDTNIVRKNCIIDIEYIGEAEAQCINIDHPDHLYITDDFVVTHNTFPVEYWQAIIDGLEENGLIPILIGKNSETQGVQPVHTEKGINLIDKLTLGQLIALISQVPSLLSNDSAPVHIAGAFDHQIILLPSCKHPDHILPWRQGSQDHKTKVLYKKLTLDDIPSAPTEMYTKLADEIVGEWDEYLPEIDEIVEAVVTSLYGKDFTQCSE